MGLYRIHVVEAIFDMGAGSARRTELHYVLLDSASPPARASVGLRHQPFDFAGPLTFDAHLPGEEGAAIMEALESVVRETVFRRRVMEQFVGPGGSLPSASLHLAINKVLTVQTEGGTPPKVINWENGPTR